MNDDTTMNDEFTRMDVSHHSVLDVEHHRLLLQQ